MEKLIDVAISFAMENKDLAETVYHYLKAEGLSVFYAPAPECQSMLSGENQRESFYRIFGLDSKYVVLIVSKYYIAKTVPMEEARIALSKHDGDGKVIPIYTDGTPLPEKLLDPRETNYFCSDNAAVIAAHIAAKIKKSQQISKQTENRSKSENSMIVEHNSAQKQVFIQSFNGDWNL